MGPYLYAVQDNQGQFKFTVGEPLWIPPGWTIVGKVQLEPVPEGSVGTLQQRPNESQGPTPKA